MIHVAVMGFGVVGSGVVEVIHNNARKISASAANDIDVKYILDIRDFPESPFRDKIVNDFAIIENDPDVQVVVECMGGVRAAYEFTKRSLMAGKSVVTSNKELVAARGAELLKLAKDKNLNYLFEASVGGGIPIIRPISQCLAANEITEIFGILNGTTNYILTQMIECGVSFKEALSEAQRLGYAEANPAADVEGADTCRKICILSSLAYGKHVYPDDVPTEGITDVCLEDVRLAGKAGCRIKLVGRSVRMPNGQVAAYVAPHLVPGTSLLSDVSGVFNGIVVRGNAIDEVMFYGRGAGKLPTASAVVADIIDASKHLSARKYLMWDDAVPGMMCGTDGLSQSFYVRFDSPCDMSPAATPSEILSETALITAPMTRAQLDDALARLPAKTVSVMAVLK